MWVVVEEGVEVKNGWRGSDIYAKLARQCDACSACVTCTRSGGGAVRRVRCSGRRGASGWVTLPGTVKGRVTEDSMYEQMEGCHKEMLTTWVRSAD